MLQQLNVVDDSCEFTVHTRVMRKADFEHKL